MHLFIKFGILGVELSGAAGPRKERGSKRVQKPILKCCREDELQQHTSLLGVGKRAEMLRRRLRTIRQYYCA